MRPYAKHITLVYLSCLLGVVSRAAFANQVSAIVSLDSGEAYSHLIGVPPTVQTPWIDISTGQWGTPWIFELVVNAYGDVTDATLISGPKSQRDEATQAAHSLKFKPFERDGHSIAVRFRFSISGKPNDYKGPANRAVTLDAPAKQVTIALQRTACFGTCPDYRVEIRADGQVTYQGKGFVLVRGVHQWQISPTAVTHLLDLIRRADFFKLKGYYEVDASDLPTYITRVSIGDQNKTVLDYGGSGMGGAFASTSFGGPSPNMPDIVTEIEDAIDVAAEDVSWVQGDNDSVSKLKVAHWNFHSREAGFALSKLIADCNTVIARQFLAEGAPINVKERDWYGGSLPVSAARCSDIDLTRLLIAKGALAAQKEKKAFLLSSVGSGNPDMVALALKYFRNTKITDSDGKPLLSVAANATQRSDDVKDAANFNPAKVISMLIAAGADINAKDNDGNTPLFEADSEEVARILIKAGAYPNARNADGQTPLFDHYFADPKKVLLESGADVTIRDRYGQTALFNQNSAEAVNAIIAAGADVNALALNGHTALDAAQSEAVALALIKAGAKLPIDQDRLQQLLKRATSNNWKQLLAILEKTTETTSEH